MPIERLTNSELTYYLIAFDEAGHEYSKDADGSDGLLSRRLLADVSRQPITDVFLMSHGWKGDIPAAREQYQNWVKAATNCRADLDRLREEYPNFQPLIVGLHWPSLPWGDEEFRQEAVAFADASETVLEELVDRYAKQFGDRSSVRDALQTIFRAAQQNPVPEEVPEDVWSAYGRLACEAQLGGEGEGGPPGTDRDPFNPEQSYEAAQEEAISFGGTDPREWLLSPLRQLSFWKMKARARRFGEGSAHALLKALQSARSDLRLHLMGHSFGCIVMSAAVAGPSVGLGLPRPVQSLVLVQGALSLWSYCGSIPAKPKRTGYFRPIIDGNRVAGPIVTTQSHLDTALGRWYPLGAEVARQIDLAPSDLPRYGAVGVFGLRGPGLDIVDKAMLPANQPYRFETGRIYNLESSEYIREGGGSSGAHSDIAHPEVAHVVWEAAVPEPLTCNGIDGSNGDYLWNSPRKVDRGLTVILPVRTPPGRRTPASNADV